MRKIVSTDVLIVGGGFSGMNFARILGKKGISCNLISNGHGASSFWNGTVDLLNYPGDNFELELAKFQVSLKDHPYAKLSYSEIQDCLKEFGQNHANIEFYYEDEKLINRHVITPLGTTKLCVGKWKSIFSHYDTFTPKTNCVLVDFEEMDNSTSPLIALGLKEKFKGNFYVLSLSLQKMFSLLDIDESKALNFSDLNSKIIAEFMDVHSEHIELLVPWIKAEFQDQFMNIEFSSISNCLFPATLGIQSTNRLLSTLSRKLGVMCSEYLVYSPTILSERLIFEMKAQLELSGVSVENHSILKSVSPSDDSLGWIAHVHNSHSNEDYSIQSKYIIFATGSIFVEGLFENSLKFANIFLNLGLEFPESLDHQFEILSSRDKSNIFVIGSAIFHFSTNLGEDDEIQDGTGLGMAIATSYKAAQVIINREKK